MTAAISERAACLRRAEALTTGPREEQYGEMVPAMQMVATMWTAYLGFRVEAEQVCMCLALLKIVRTAGNSTHVDSYDDAAAYVAMALECAKAGVAG